MGMLAPSTQLSRPPLTRILRPLSGSRQPPLSPLLYFLPTLHYSSLGDSHDQYQSSVETCCPSQWPRRACRSPTFRVASPGSTSGPSPRPCQTSFHRPHHAHLD